MEDDFWNFEKQQDYLELKKFLDIKRKVESVQDRQRHISVLNTSRYVYGLSMAEIRKTAREILRHKPYSYLNNFCGDSYEEVMIEGLVIVGLKDREKILDYLKPWINKIDCWSLCDSIISSMKFLKNSNLKDTYYKWFVEISQSKDEMISRFGIVSLMEYYLDDEHIDEVISLCCQIKNDSYYSQMAVAWLISSAYTVYKTKVIELLKSKKLNTFVQNKAISKCCDSFRVSAEEKTELKKLKIKKS